MTREVVFSPEAQTDLIAIYDYIAPRGGPDRALAYVERIQTACLSFAMFAERGTQRDDIRPGLRVAGFENRVTIAFHADLNHVIIDRLLYGGRDLEGAFSDH